MSTLKVNTIQNTSGGSSSTPENIEQGREKAWVNFTGTGTAAMEDEFGISSFTDNGTGHYTLGFDTSFANANYCYTTGGTGTQQGSRTTKDVNQFVGSFDFKVRGGAGVFDPIRFCVSFFGDQ